jgi:hypothetical protein
VFDGIRDLLGMKPIVREVAGFAPTEAPKPAGKPPADFFVVGLDLGQSADYTALAVDHITHRPDLDRPGKWCRIHNIRHLQRWQLRTSYMDIADDLGKLLRHLPGAALAADKTGVGGACIDIFRSAKLPCRLVPVLITGGHQTTRDGNEWHVPKKELVSAVQSALQQRRFSWSDLPLTKVLRKEMETFRVKVSAATGNETFEAWRERDHDDLVLAVALAVWYGERGAGTRFTFFA